VHSGDLSRDQLKVLYERLRPMSDYLGRLQRRMEDQQFSEADRLYREVVAAHYTAQQLVEELHRLWCGPSYTAPVAQSGRTN